MIAQGEEFSSHPFLFSTFICNGSAKTLDFINEHHSQT